MSNSSFSQNPYEARLITSDIHNFWTTFDKADGVIGEDRIKIFEEGYFQNGSIGLQDFIELRIKSAASLVETIDKHPRFYRSIRESTLQVDKMKPDIERFFVNLKSIYPDAIFPDVYFLIGRMNSGGTGSSNGSLIGTEMHGRTEKMSLDELSSWHRQVLKPIEEIPFIVIHELIHFQQTYLGRCHNLLEQSIKEGAADFVGEIVSGEHINKHLYRYGDSHERELWRKFLQEMKGQDFSKWLFNGTQAKEYPADLGYFIGYKICESYYGKLADKHKAVWDILNIQDFEGFLHTSQYGEGF